MAHLTMHQRNTIQARWLTMKERKTGIDMVTLALNYGERLSRKISSKHLVLKKVKGN